MKRSKTLAGHELGDNFFKEGVWGDILSGKDNLTMEDMVDVLIKRLDILKK